MPKRKTCKISDKEMRRRAKIIEQCLAEGYTPIQSGRRDKTLKAALHEGARRMGLNAGTLWKQMLRGTLVVDWSKYKPIKEKAPVVPKFKPSGKDLGRGIMSMLKRSSMSTAEIASRLKVEQSEVVSCIESMRDGGVLIQSLGGSWHTVEPSQAHTHGPTLEIISRPDNTFDFGACSDNHLGSKYERLDVLNDLYDLYERVGVQAVFNAGNWVDGEAPFNRTDLHVHGMDAQLAYLAQEYPQRKGVNTYAIAGADHEGWWAKHHGVDIGRYAEMKMRDAGRNDWNNLGYMEAHVRLVNANSGLASILSVVHPGGGSAYAVSYSIQKIIESLDGGEKPAVGLYGHYHKLWCGNIRNVWCVQTGCTEDQTPFMRQKKIDAHVGGTRVRLDQDPRTGAITDCTVTLKRYFVKSYYQNRWNPAGRVSHATRAA